MTLPTFSEIEALHRKYAPSEKEFEIVFTHCQAVADIADMLYSSHMTDVDREVVRVGCLLHDIGVYRLYENGEPSDREYIRHGVLGYELLKAEGFPERLCRFCSHHTGVGLSRETIIARDLPLPHEDFFADSPEEELVMYADKFHSKGISFTEMASHFNTPESYATNVARHGQENAVKFNEMVARYGVPDLSTLSRKYGDEIL